MLTHQFTTRGDLHPLAYCVARLLNGRERTIVDLDYHTVVAVTLVEVGP